MNGIHMQKEQERVVYISEVYVEITAEAGKEVWGQTGVPEILE